jgi:hypothetical protein
VAFLFVMAADGLDRLRKGYRRVSVHVKTYEQLKQIAYGHDMSMSSLLSLSLHHFIKNHLDEVRRGK